MKPQTLLKIKFYRRNLFPDIFCMVTIVLTMTSFRNIHGQVICFGDSITQGAQVDGHSWVWYLSKEHGDINFINAGRNGRKTSEREDFLPVLNAFPNAGYYLIFLGVNDLKDGTDSMVKNCVVNVSWMIREIRSVNNRAEIVILAPPDINLETMNAVNVQKKYNENTQRSLYRLGKRYRALAKTAQAGFISLLHTVSKSNYADGLHPDKEGQKQLAKEVWKKLNRLY